jgi:hypothetical protein
VDRLLTISLCGCVARNVCNDHINKHGRGEQKLCDTYAFLLNHLRHDKFTKKMYESSRHCVIPQSEELGGSLGQDVAEALGARAGAGAGRRSGGGTLKTKGT